MGIGKVGESIRSLGLVPGDRTGCGLWRRLPGRGRRPENLIHRWVGGHNGEATWRRSFRSEPALLFRRRPLRFAGPQIPWPFAPVLDQWCPVLMFTVPVPLNANTFPSAVAERQAETNNFLGIHRRPTTYGIASLPSSATQSHRTLTSPSTKRAIAG